MTTKLGGRPWSRLVNHIVRRDPDCQLKYEGICTGRSETADHIVPYSKGGTNDPSNLRGSCHPCNRHRGAGPDPVTDSSRWSRQWV